MVSRKLLAMLLALIIVAFAVLLIVVVNNLPPGPPEKVETGPLSYVVSKGLFITDPINVILG